MKKYLEEAVGETVAAVALREKTQCRSTAGKFILDQYLLRRHDPVVAAVQGEG